MKTDDEWMREAVKEAFYDERSDIKVGAVIVKEGRPLAQYHGVENAPEGYESNHAEYMTIKQCQEEMQGATLYTTLEPCTMMARDPWVHTCTGEILKAGIGRVVYGLDDPNPYVYGREDLGKRHVDCERIGNAELIEAIENINRPLLSRVWPYFKKNYDINLDINFVGYDEKREELRDWLCRQGSDGANPILQIVAPGGTGKSSLGWFWVHRDIVCRELPGVRKYYKKSDRKTPVPDYEPCVVVWFSFYGSGMAGTFKEFLEVLEKAIDESTSGDGEVRAMQHPSGRDVSRLLEDKRFLVIWDGAERLLDAYKAEKDLYRPEVSEESVQDHEKKVIDNAAWAFLRMVVNCKNCKLLILSRLPFAELDDSAAGLWRLTGISQEDAEQYLREKIDTSLSFSEIRKLCECLGTPVPQDGGMRIHPLSLNLVAKALQKNKKNSDPLLGRDLIEFVSKDLKPEDRRRHVLEWSYNKFSHTEKGLISRMAAILERKVSVAMIRLIAPGKRSIYSNRVERTLEELVEKGFLNGPIREETEKYYTFHPAVRAYAYSQLNEEDRRRVHDQLVEYYGKKSMKEDISSAKSTGEIAPHIQQYFHMLGASDFEGAFRLLKDRLFPKIYRGLANYPLALEMLYELVRSGKEEVPPLKRIDDQVWVLEMLGQVYTRLGRLDKAEECYNWVIKSSRSKIPPTRGLTTFKNRPIFADFLGHVGGILRLLIKRPVQPNRLFRSVCFRSSDVYLKRGQLEEALSGIKRAEELLDNMKGIFGEEYPFEKIPLLWEHGRTLVYLGQYEKAKNIFDAALSLIPRQGGKKRRARSVIYAYRAIGNLFENCIPEAYNDAESAYKDACEDKNASVRDEIRALWLKASARISMVDKAVNESENVAWLNEAESDLLRAKEECKKVIFLELEIPILLEWARLCLIRYAHEQADGREKLLKEAEQTATEARALARRLDFKMDMVDIYNFCAEFYLIKGDKESALREVNQASQKAQEYGYESAKHRAEGLRKRIQS